MQRIGKKIAKSEKNAKEKTLWEEIKKKFVRTKIKKKKKSLIYGYLTTRKIS